MDEKKGWFQVYKPGEGYATRLGAFVVALGFVFFTSYHWYYGWVFLRNFGLRVFGAIGLEGLLKWTEDVSAARSIQLIGAGVAFIMGALVAYFYIYVNPRSAEFLAKTDIELGKVTWPRITPWFKADTQVWGSTYVVLIVVAFLTIYVFTVDSAFNVLARWLFYRE